MNYSKQDIQKAYEQAPKVIKKLAASESLGVAVWSRTQSLNLSDDQKFDLENITRIVLLGLLHPKDLVSTIATELELSLEKSQELVKIINTEIFSLVKDELIAIHKLSTKKKGVGAKKITKKDERVPHSQYSTSPELFEKKLKSSVISQHKKNESHTIPVEKAEDEPPKPPRDDSYREPIEE